MYENSYNEDTQTSEWHTADRETFIFRVEQPSL